MPRAFRLLAAEARTPVLGQKLGEIGNDIQGGSTGIWRASAVYGSKSLPFYVNMCARGGGGQTR